MKTIKEEARCLLREAKEATNTGPQEELSKELREVSQLTHLAQRGESTHTLSSEVSQLTHLAQRGESTHTLSSAM